MNVNINPINPRTLVPVQVEVAGAHNRPLITVHPQDNAGAIQPFVIPLSKQNSSEWQGEFWFEWPGTYTVEWNNNGTVQHQVMTVSEQKFLGFGGEFGLFVMTLVFTATLIWFWFYRRSRVVLQSKESYESQ